MREHETEHGQEPVGWATLLPLCCIVVLSVATLVSGIHASMASVLRPVPGDLIRIAARVDTARGTKAIFTATRPDGATCQIGVGEAAAAGGSLLVVRREAEGGLAAVWASTGRSASAGTDCGNGSELRLTDAQFRSLQGATRLNPGLPDTGLVLDAPIPMMP